MMNKTTLAIILGGGQGSRLAPLTESRSKPAVPIAGKYRLVDIPISNCINSDIKRMFVLTQFNSASLNQHIKNTYHFSHFSTAFVDILAAEQTPENPTWFQGTADAVRQCMQHFMNHDFDYALILSGDQLYQMDFNHMIEAHHNSGADISIATLPVNAKDAPEFGILKTNSENFITSFIEKPHQSLLQDWTSEVSDEMKEDGKIYLASMGIYIFNRDLLVELMQNQETKDFGKEIIPQAIGNKRILSYQYEGYWTDIGNIDSFFEANLGLTDEIPKFNLFDNSSKIYTRARVLPPSKIAGTSSFDRSVVAEGCIIDSAKIEHSVVGIRSRVGKGSSISNSYLMGNDFYQNLEEISSNYTNHVINIGIGERCNINYTIVDKNCRIGNDVQLLGGKHLEDTNTPLYTVKDGIIVVKKGAVLPDGFTVG
ncbi:glucose-1-phosphate adenylyltransferase [Flavobacterium noncentrifugens]|uniref:Glucose-1-phosphate adenylyltransferase n=1 Tax=Flavobacterium noncentrifugens TaxID=1128970 RepID=A0A1G8YPF6_9FLAO|nr:glucose-1-phosphate adenylyltransferase [Flavobacterium noncentrifugens]GEP51306.1 glucose-1-phosphate adenylyltransferase [Flavobacterium noncentrifugens]SDK04626.1 glucose-1-phosphate adenylyltransferase [Flavobacterium noncentrifugens]